MHKQALPIIDYLGLYKGKDFDKKNKKRLNKRNIIQCFKFYKYNDNNVLDVIKKYLLTSKKKFSTKGKRIPAIGIFFDSNVIIHDITFLPPTPNKYDILCIESQIKEYKDSKDSNIYWSQVDVINSGNFIINIDSINLVLEIIKKLLTKNDQKDDVPINIMHDFFTILNEQCKIFSITQYQLSEQNTLNVPDQVIINNNITTEQYKMYIDNLSSLYYNKFQGDLKLRCDLNLPKLAVNCNLPKVSLICIFTNKDLFFHNLLSFLKLEYPRDLLELIIIDDTNSEKELNLPEDKRIRLINLDKSAPLGYKLNIGVKYASNELISHFFDTNNYNVTNFKQNILHFVISNKMCISSVNTGVYPKYEQNIPDIANLIYIKLFWKNNSFNENKNDTNISLIYKFVMYRTLCILFLPFIHMSFKIKNDQSNLISNYLPFDLDITIPDSIKTSFELIK